MAKNKQIAIADTKHLCKCEARELQMIQRKYDGASLEELREEFGYSDKIAVANLLPALITAPLIVLALS